MIGRYSNLGEPINRSAPGVGRVTNWWMSLPGLDGGTRLYDLVGPNHGAVTQGSWNLQASNGPRPPRPGGLNNRVVQGVAASTAVDCGEVTSFEGAVYAVLSGWIWKGVTSDGSAIGRMADTSHRFGIAWFTDQNIYFAVDTGAAQAYRVISMTGQTGWRFCELVYDGSQTGTARIAVYINGVNQTGTTSGTPPASIPAIAQSFTYNVTNGSSAAHRGAYDDVQIQVASGTQPFKSRYLESYYGNPVAIARWKRRPVNSVATTSGGVWLLTA